MQRNATFNVTVQPLDDQVVAAVKGEVDISNAAELALRLEGAARQALPRHLTVDLSDLRYMDSSGLRSLITVHNAHPQTRLVVRSGSLVARILSVSQLDGVFDIQRVPQ
ncbi:MAG TPA: STAS domain-containing protein [Armatimonadota bacterium]|jgi:anti-anti-sigma factor